MERPFHTGKFLQQHRPQGSEPAHAATFNAARLAQLVADPRFDGNISVTCRGKVDGAGAQALATVSAMVMARFAHCRYLHSPFTSMAHADGDRMDWARRWERFLNFGDGEPVVPEGAELATLNAVLDSPERHANRPIVIAERLFALPHGSSVVREALRPVLRARYWRSPKSSIPSHRGPPGCITVAVHVRRGDVTEVKHAYRFVSHEFVLRQIARVKEALAPFGRPMTINIYSEGASAEFSAFAQAGCNLYVSEDAFETFHNMVIADVLVVGCSSFSYVAGALSEGIVLGHRRGDRRLSNWIGRRRDGDVPIARLRRAMLQRMGWRMLYAYRGRRFWRWLRHRLRAIVS